MQVNGMSGMGQMDMTQMRLRDGSGQGQQVQGQGQGNGMQNGLKDLMQALSPEDRTMVQDQLSNLSQEDRKAAVEQLKQIDPTSMSSDSLTQYVLGIVNPNTQVSNTSSVSIYA